MENTINKPLSVARVDFINNAYDLINNCGLPPFVIEMIIKDLYVEVKRAADKQYEIDLAGYNQVIAEVSKEA